MGSESDDKIESDELLGALFRGLNDAVIVIDARGVIVRASDSVRTLTGWTPEQLLGKNISSLMPEPHRSNHDGYLARYMETGRTWILGTAREFGIVRRDGTHLPCELSVSRIDLPNRREPHFCGTFRDISEREAARQRLARSEAKFRAVFENENQLVLLLDADGRVVEANRPTYLRTGTSPEQVVGRALDELRIWSQVPGNREAVGRALAEAVASGLATGRAAVDVVGSRLAWDDIDPIEEVTFVSRQHEISIRTLDQQDPGFPSAIVEVRDVTELVEVENRESAIIRSLARVGEEAAVLAHELKSPVSELELALKALSRHLGEEDSALLKDLAKRMRRLEDLLRRTLGFSTPLKLSLRPLSVQDAFARVLEREQGTLQSHHIRTTVHINTETPLLEADGAALDDALSNLLRNAAEAQIDGGRIRLTAEPHDGMVRLVVEDEGPGIPLEKREDVFRVFFSEKDDGTGFGLALVRKIVEGHGARVCLESGPGDLGLRVVLDWPAVGFTPPKLGVETPSSP